MEVKCPPYLRKFVLDGEEFTSTPTGIAEVEHRDGQEIYVEKYGIMHTFEPPNPPPKHIFREGQFSDICRSFMEGDMSTVRLQVKELMEEPILLEKVEKGGLLRKNRISIENGILDAHQLDELASTAGCEDFVLHNPTKTTIQMLKKRGIVYSKIVFFGNPAENRPDTPQRANFLLYKNFMLSYLRRENFQYDLLPDGTTDPRYFYYGGFSNVVHRHHQNFISLELSPYAYKSSSRIFDSLEEREDGLYYRTTLTKNNIIQHKYGHYPYTGPHYRYQPDIVSARYGKIGQKWGLYGLLSSVVLPEFSSSSRPEGVGRVTHSTMYSAYVLPADNVREAKRYVATNLNCRTLDQVSNMLRRHEKVDEHGRSFRENRFFFFRGSGFVLDTGQRYHFSVDPDGDLSYRGRKYKREVSAQQSVLTLSSDPYGTITYDGGPVRVLWHISNPYFLTLTPSVKMIDFSHRHTHYYDLRVHTRPVYEEEIG